MKKTSRDLTQGSIAPLLVSFALPVFMGQFLQTLYNSVDSMVVGNFVGKTALAAVSSSTDITFILVGFFNGLSAGAGVLFARYFGAKDYKKLHDCIHTALTFGLILGLVMAALGALLSGVMLRWMSCPDDVFPEAVLYLRIYFVGVLCSSLYNLGAGILRSVGDSRSPFIYLVISTILNIVLDIIFVAVFNWGVAGVGIATILAQLVSCILVMVNMMRTDDVHKLVLKDLGIDKDILKQVVRLAVPSGLQMSITALSNIFIQSFVNVFGSAAMAAMGAAKRIDKFIEIIGNSIGVATSTVISQNLGAGKPKRAFKSIKVAWAVVYGLIAVFGSLIFIFAEPAVRIFTDDAETINYAVRIVRMLLPFYFIQSVFQIMSNAGRGFGKSSAVMMLSITGLVIIRQIYLNIAAAIHNSIMVVAFAFPAGWIGGAVLCAGYFFLHIVRKRIWEKDPVTGKIPAKK